MDFINIEERKPTKNGMYHIYVCGLFNRVRRTPWVLEWSDGEWLRNSDGEVEMIVIAWLDWESNLLADAIEKGIDTVTAYREPLKPEVAYSEDVKIWVKGFNDGLAMAEINTKNIIQLLKDKMKYISLKFKINNHDT